MGENNHHDNKTRRAPPSPPRRSAALLTVGLLGGCLCRRLGLGLALVQCSSLSPAVGRSMRAWAGGTGRPTAACGAGADAGGRAALDAPGPARGSQRWTRSIRPLPAVSQVASSHPVRLFVFPAGRTHSPCSSVLIFSAQGLQC